MTGQCQRSPTLAALVAMTIAAGILARAPGASAAQNCEALPAGPARTDCYMVRARIYREKANIATSTARVEADAARLRTVTGAGGHRKGRGSKNKRPRQ
jgi:hypothetical protein